jgi:hypothetical protein
MATIEVDLQKLSVLGQEISILESKKKSLESDIERLSQECATMKDLASKEIAQSKQQNDAECQEKQVIADAILNEAKSKLATAEVRLKESLTIDKQIKELDKKTKLFKETEKQLEDAKIQCAERENKANLLIEQYKKKLDELK